MERTISGMVGKGSVNHNTRAFTAKNVDSDRSGANVHFIINCLMKHLNDIMKSKNVRIE
mgnify:CR=1 FL=1